MEKELLELLETAIYREIASQAFYQAGQSRAEDPAARALMEALAGEEIRHAQILRGLCEGGACGAEWRGDRRRREEIQDLKVSQYVTGSPTLAGAGLQDTLICAMKREQEAVEFYARMMGLFLSEQAKQLCERLTYEELKHKQRLEIFYDSVFNAEN